MCIASYTQLGLLNIRIGQIFAQHESNLTSHSRILDMVKFHVAAESDAFRTVSLMLSRTRELMEELKVMQRDFVRSLALTDLTLDLSWD